MRLTNRPARPKAADKSDASLRYSVDNGRVIRFYLIEGRHDRGGVQGDADAPDASGGCPGHGMPMIPMPREAA